MARGDKDNTAKEAALRFCVASGFVPYLEVDVLTGLEFSASPKLLTDIDVLGIMVRDDGSHARTIFDCKSTGGPAFARALWLAGLMSFVNADEGMILMGKPAERAHRLAARKLNVRLFGSNSFDSYAAASGSEYAVLSSYAGTLENWLSRADFLIKHPAISDIYKSIVEEVPLSSDPARSLRRLISRAREHKGEMNPTNRGHQAIFAELVTAVSLLLGMMVGDLRNLIDLNDGEKEYTAVLRYYLWGGHEGVETLKKLYLLVGKAGQEEEPETAMVAWPQLVQLTRGLLEAPTSVRHSTFALRELSLRYSAKIDAAADQRLGRLFQAPRSRQFAKRISGYTASVMRVPHEFAEKLDRDIDDLVAGVARPLSPPGFAAGK